MRQIIYEHLNCCRLHIAIFLQTRAVLVAFSHGSVTCAAVFMIIVFMFELAVKMVLCRRFKEFYRNCHKLLIVICLLSCIDAVTAGLIYILCGLFDMAMHASSQYHTVGIVYFLAIC